jgi:tetratricopeptide (TPR) repeat protein
MARRQGQSDSRSRAADQKRHAGDGGRSFGPERRRWLDPAAEFSGETNREAQRLFERALERDPHFSAAMARLAYAMVLNAIYFGADPATGLLDKALDLAREASRLDPRDAVCRYALGRVYLARIADIGIDKLGDRLVTFRLETARPGFRGKENRLMGEDIAV